MRKKFFLVLFFLALCCISIFASDSFKFLASNKTYCNFVSEVKNNKGKDSVLLLYGELEKAYNENPSEENTIALLRSTCTLSHFYVENKESKLAKKAIKKAYSLFDELQDLEERMLLPLEFCIISIDYLTTPLLISKGLESTKIIDKAYEKYPDELTIKLLYASRRLNAPAIGGGDSREAVALFEEMALNEASQASPWDQFDIYFGFASAIIETKINFEAEFYLKQALAIYPSEMAAKELLSDLRK